MQTSSSLLVPSSELRSVKVRPHLRDGFVSALSGVGRLAQARRDAARSGSVLILTLHRIVPDEQVSTCRSPRGMVLRESTFIQLLKYLQEDADVIAPGQVDRWYTHPERVRILLTFDDGWLDNLQVAHRHLTAARIRACFFLSTGLIGRSQPFWPEQIIDLLQRARSRGTMAPLHHLIEALQPGQKKQSVRIEDSTHDEALLTWLKQFSALILQRHIDLAREELQVLHPADAENETANDDPMERLLAWDQVRALSDAGHSIGSHTQTHALLPQLPQDELIRELHGSYQMLRAQLSKATQGDLWISYPNGAASRQVALATRQVGYTHGFLNTAGLWTAKTNPYLLPRVNVWDGTLLDAKGNFCQRQLEYNFYWRTVRAQSAL